MAIKADYVTRGGVSVPDSYIRVTDLHIGRQPEGFKLAFNVAAFVDQETAAQAHRTVDEPRGYQCPYDPEGAGPYAQAYEWLTRTTEGDEGPFPGAVRV